MDQTWHNQENDYWEFARFFDKYARQTRSPHGNEHFLCVTRRIGRLGYGEVPRIQLRRSIQEQPGPVHRYL